MPEVLIVVMVEHVGAQLPVLNDAVAPAGRLRALNPMFSIGADVYVAVVTKLMIFPTSVCPDVGALLMLKAACA